MLHVSLHFFRITLRKNVSASALDAKCESRDNNYSEAQSRNISLDGLFCNSDLSNATVNINVNLSK